MFLGLNYCLIIIFFYELLASKITRNVRKNLDSVSMAPPVDKPGHPPDVTALIVTKETDVATALSRGGEPGHTQV